MRSHLIPLVAALFLALTGCAANGDLCTGPKMADPLSDCYCADIPRDGDPPYSTNAPPEYQAEVLTPEGSPSLYAPEAVTPSHGSGLPHGPVVPR